MVKILLLALFSYLLGVYGIETDAKFSKTYNEDLARLLLKLDGASFAADPTSCLAAITNPDEGWSIIDEVNVKCSWQGNNFCRFLILKSDVKKQFIFAFRGTVGDSQLVAEALNSDKLNFENYGKAHKYFRNAFVQVWEHVERVIHDTKRTDYSIIFTGYSLGGALASLSALKTIGDKHHSAENVYLLTFGEPRVGDFKLAQSINSYVKYAHRVVNKADFIAHFPKCMKIGSKCSRLGYYHHDTEIWYPDGMDAGASYVVTTEGESQEGSNKLGGKYKIKDHLSYFGLNLEKWAADGCPSNVI